MRCTVMALVTLASFDRAQTEHHSMAFFIVRPSELQARAHLQCMARNQLLNIDAIKYSAYFTCLHAHSLDALQ